MEENSQFLLVQTNIGISIFIRACDTGVLEDVQTAHLYGKGTEQSIRTDSTVGRQFTLSVERPGRRGKPGTTVRNH